MNTAGQKKTIKTSSRTSTVFPDMVGHTIAVHDGRKHVPVFVSESRSVTSWASSRSRGPFWVTSRPTARREGKQAWQSGHRQSTCASRRARRVRSSTCIRGKSVADARSTLFFANRAAARDVAKVLNSAFANAEKTQQPLGGRAVRQRGARGRGPDPQALAVPRHGPGQSICKRSSPSASPSSRGRSVPSRPEGARGGFTSASSTTGSGPGIRTKELKEFLLGGWRHPSSHPAQARPRRPLRIIGPQGPEQRHHRHPHGAAGHRGPARAAPRSTRCAKSSTR